MHTRFQSKLSNFGDETSFASESNAELAISATKTISIMLAAIISPIPVIHETHWYVNSLCPFFPFAQWTLWRTVMIHRLFFHSFYWLKAGRWRQGFSGLYTFFIRFSLRHISRSNFRVDETSQAIYSDRKFRFSYILFITIYGGILILYIYMYIYIYTYI